MVEAKGWAVVEDGALDMKTVYAHRRGAIVNWLFMRARLSITNSMSDAHIELLWRHHRAGAKVVPVRIMTEETADEPAS